MSQHRVLFGTTIDVCTNFQDIQFCQRWFREHGAGWPHTADGIHPSLSGAVRIYEQHHAIWAALIREQEMIRLRHNSGIVHNQARDDELAHWRRLIRRESVRAAE